MNWLLYGCIAAAVVAVCAAVVAVRAALTVVARLKGFNDAQRGPK